MATQKPLVIGSGTTAQFPSVSGDSLEIDGAVLAKNTTDSVTAFRVQNAAGTVTVLDVDTTNARVGVGTAAPTASLSVGSSGTERFRVDGATGRIVEYSDGVPANGEVLIGNGTNFAKSTLTAGTNIAVTNGSGTVSIGLTGTVGVANGGTGTATAFTTGSVVFAGASGVYTQDNANFFWDNTNNRLGIGTSAPGASLEVANSDALVYGLTVGRGGGAVADNTAVGLNALAVNTIGAGNVALGRQTLAQNLAQSGNTAVGTSAQSKSSGSENTSVGASSLNTNTGSNCVAVGVNALQANTGSNCVAVGYAALDNNTGVANVAVGSSAMGAAVTGASNVAVGFSALAANTAGGFSVAVGAAALGAATTSDGNVGVGATAGGNITTGGVTTGNTALGTAALGADVASPGLTGDGNVAVGYSALGLLTGAVSNNTAIGTQAMDAATSAQNCVAVGANALGANTTASGNTAVGANALAANTVNTQNVAVGFNALLSADADFNTAVGHSAGDSVTTGSHNTLIGNSAGSSTTTSAGLTVVGSNAGTAITAGVANQDSTAIGFNAEVGNTSTGQNTVVGSSAGNLISSGTNLTCIGFNAEPNAPTSTNEITLGANVVGTILRCVATTITAISDQRDKADIQDLSLGLDFLSTIRPVQFKWDRRDWYKDGVSDGSKKQDKFEPGFIAQELDAAQTAAKAEWMALALKGNPDRWEATPMRLFPVVVKACQELAAQAAAATARAIEAERRLDALEAALADLQNA